MIFGALPLAEAEDAILAHSLMIAGRKWSKGRRLTHSDLEALAAEGHVSVIAARLEPGDVEEDTAATRIAAAIAGPGLTARTAATGRVNLQADLDGLLVVDTAAVNRMNAVAECLTLATLPAFEPVAPGIIVATVKIIPFAVPEAALAACEAAAGPRPLCVAPWRPKRVGLLQTRVAGTKESVLDKTTETTAARIDACGGALVAEHRCAHLGPEVAVALEALRAGGCDLLLMIGASAITDRADVLPAALTAVGGCVEHFGMPVDPGNLLMLGSWQGMPVLGLPGCARSPKLNGADWVLRRLMADIPVGPRDIMGMGVGGLVTDVPDRPLPRARVDRL